MRILDRIQVRVLFVVFLTMALLAPTLTVEAKAPDEQRVIDVPTVPARDDQPDVASPRPVSAVPIVERIGDVPELREQEDPVLESEELVPIEYVPVHPERIAETLIKDESSPLSAVVANTDGSISIVASESPVRTFDAATEEWIPIDLILVNKGEEGWVSPTAGLVDVSIFVGVPTVGESRPNVDGDLSEPDDIARDRAGGLESDSVAGTVPVAAVTIDDGSQFVLSFPERSDVSLGQVVNEPVELESLIQDDGVRQLNEVAAIAVPAEHSSVKVDDVFDNGVDLEIEATAVGAKWTYEVADLATATDGSLKETLTIPQGWTAENSNGSIVLIDPDGEVGAIWSGGPVYDSADLSLGELQVTGTHAAMELVSFEDGVATARVVVDERWLSSADRVWPVFVDPTMGMSMRYWPATNTNQYAAVSISTGDTDYAWVGFTHLFMGANYPGYGAGTGVSISNFDIECSVS